MTTTALPPARIPAARVSLWDRLTVVLLGALGFALSYDALRQMAAAIHVRGPLTYVFPLIIDGFIAYGVRALLVLREAPRPARAYAWTLFTGATAASVWANALHAVRLNDLTGTDSRLRLSDTVVGFLSILAPLALGGAVHLYILIARHGQNTVIRRGEQIDDPHSGTSADSVAADHDEDVQPQRLEDRSDETALLTLLSAAGVLPSEWSDALPGRQAAEGDAQLFDTANTPAGDSAEVAESAGESQVGGGDSTAEGKPVGRPPGASMEQLLEVSRAAVAAHGRLSRAVVEQAVREAGLPLGSTRLTELMKRLRQESGGAVPKLREALTDYKHMSPLLASESTDPPPDLEILRAEVGSAWSAYQDARYARATRLIPEILADAQRAVRAYDGEEQLKAKALLAMAYQGAAMVLTKIGEADLAWMAADRGLAAAQESGDLVVTGSLFRSVSHCLLSSGRLTAARDLVADSAGYLESGLADASPTYLSIYGTLFLVGAVTAARLDDRATVSAFLAEADQAAQRLGHDANHMWTAFGPTNVAIHRISTAMELGDVQVAADQGPRVDSSTLPLERRVRHTLEVARAYSAQNRMDEALALVLDAEELAPEQVRYHFIPRHLVTTWVRQQRGKPSHQLAGVAQRLRIVG